MSDPAPGSGIDESLVDELAATITRRGDQLRERIAAITDRPVRVVAITKGHPAELAAAALRAGFTELGENYAQEMLAKIEALGEERASAANWHFVGHLQSNKVRLLAGRVGLWQSVDRRSLVGELAKRDPGASVLIQADLAGTEGRAGAPRKEVAPLVEHARASGLDVRGLMGVAAPEPDRARAGFSWLASTARHLGLSEVSMGMSGDLEAALVAGATMVRIGSDLVGPRPR